MDNKKDIGMLSELDLQEGDQLMLIKKAKNDGGWAMPNPTEMIYVRKYSNGELGFYGIGKSYWGEVKSIFKVVKRANAHQEQDMKEEQVGILAELNLKAGDTVEYVSGSYCSSEVYKDLVWTVYDTHPKGNCKEAVAYYDRGHSDGYMRLSNKHWKFRVISRKETIKRWKELTDAEQGALLLAHHKGKAIECCNPSIKGIKWFIAKEPKWIADIAYREVKDAPLSWSPWMISSKDGKTKVDLNRFPEHEKFELPDSKQFVYRTKGKMK